MAITAAIPPKMMKRQASASPSCSSMIQYASTPMIGPVVDPTPPITTMKITSAVHRVTLNADPAVVEVVWSRITAPWTRSWPR